MDLAAPELELSHAQIVLTINQRIASLDWNIGLWVVAIYPEIVVQKRVSNRDVSTYPADPWRYIDWDINQEPESITEFVKSSIAQITQKITTEEYVDSLLNSGLHESIKQKIREISYDWKPTVHIRY